MRISQQNSNKMVIKETPILQIIMLTLFAAGFGFSTIKSNNSISNDPFYLQVENLFENKFARLIRGDASKVSKVNQKLLKNRAVGFPSNQNMLLDTGEKLKNIIKDMIFEHER